LASPDGDVYLRKPTIYQMTAGVRREIAGRYELTGNNRVGFEVGPYDRSQTLVIDPVLSYSTYLGGSAQDNGRAIALDSAGNAYVTGATASTNFPGASSSAIQPTFGGFQDAFVAKLNATGTALLYSTYLGGSAGDYAGGIALDSSGNAYVTGFTGSTNFPLRN